MAPRISKRRLKLYEVKAKETNIFIYRVYALSPEEVVRLVNEGQVVLTRRGIEKREITKITEVGNNAQRYSVMGSHNLRKKRKKL